MRYCVFLFFVVIACRRQVNSPPYGVSSRDTALFAGFADTSYRIAQRDSTLPERIVAFAQTLKGVPYKYCSMDHNGGFDCSGFVNYVFNHFNIKVPRSSVDFTNAGEDVPLSEAKAGDLILFRGTDPHRKVVGHIGIIIANDHGDVTFIQSTSGEAYGVVVSPLDKNYMARFVKVIRIAPQR